MTKLAAAIPALLLLSACTETNEAGTTEGAPIVLAASSLQESLDEVADAYAAQGNLRPVLSFAATSSLARQVAGGAPADIFVAADHDWMDTLEAEGLLVPDSREDLLTNSIVLIAPPRSGAKGLDPLNGTHRIAMANPDAVPAGRYGKAALMKLGLWQAVAARVVPAENVRAALALVERGEAEAGIVYATDAQASGKVVVTYRFAPETHPPIVYPAALLAASEHGQQARGFLEFLSSGESQAIFGKHGFGVAP